MARCPHTLTRTQGLEVPGDQASIEVSPPITHPCHAEFTYVPHGKSDDVLAGESLDLQQQVGPVYVSGKGAGHVTLTLRSHPEGSIRVKVWCDGRDQRCGPTWTTIQLAGWEQTVVVQHVHGD